MNKKPQRGRPKLPDARKNRVVALYNDAEYAALKKSAKGYASLSDYVRERTLAR